jgi:2'-5' RNA ligase
VSSTHPSGPDKARVFFALWPEAGVQSSLHRHAGELHRRLGGKLTRQESIHLTLVFLGDTRLDRVDDARAAAARVGFEPFSMNIETAGCWSHNRVAWLAPVATPASLLALVNGLEAALNQAGFNFDARPYAPHITVLRKARCGPMDATLTPVVWRVQDFVLVRSALDSAGSRYSIIGRWPESDNKP